MFIPYGTDAPLYHRPWVTGAVIITNLAVFIAGSPDALILRHDVLEPHAWVTSNFVHADPIHLVVNMLFIWTFGQIIEGKLGWWRFLLVYLGIGIGECILEQGIALALDQATASLGASSIIYGLIAMAWVWAPENEVEVFYWIIAPGTISVANRTLAIIYIVLDAMGAALGFMAGVPITTSFLHVLGAAIGFPLAVILLRRGVVDCEGWDLFSLRHGNPRVSGITYASDALPESERNVRLRDKRRTALMEAAALIESGKPASALEVLDTIVSGEPVEIAEKERLEARARELIDNGTLELDIEEEWSPTP